MAPKQKTPAPIDRPLSRAYLRKFTGWSSAYPPGLSDPTSLRVMENTLVRRDGSVSVRPGLRYLSYETLPAGAVPGVGIEEELVGTHEAFFLNDGTKAYLFAVREADDTVGFRVLELASSGSLVHGLTDAGVDFDIPQGEAQLNFTAETTYVKYLQIDNKIFALSNAGESMRLFTVGESKTAKRLTAISRPEWTVTDKLTVVHPDEAWINSGIPTGTRTNLILNPSFETNTAGWVAGATAEPEMGRVASPAGQSGSYCLSLESKPERTNLIPQPLHDVATTGLTGWSAGTNADVTANGADLEVQRISNGRYYTNGPEFDCEPGVSYSIAFDLTAFANNFSNDTTYGVLVRWYTSAGVKVGSDTVDYVSPSVGRKVTDDGAFVAPAGAFRARVFLSSYSTTPGAYFRVNDVLACEVGEPTTMFTGDSGTDYSWVGSDNDSASVYHPATALHVLTSDFMAAAAGQDYTASAYVRTSGTARDAQIGIYWYDSGESLLSASWGALDSDAADWTTRLEETATAPVGAVKAKVTVYYPVASAVPRGETHYVDSVLFEQAAAIDTYFDGSTTDTGTEIYAWSGLAHGSSSTRTDYTLGTSIPSAETPTVDTLISSAAADNVYNFGFFYTFANEVGESAASQITVVRTQRPWSGWRWETPNASGEPSGTRTEDPAATADQLVASLPEAVFDQALTEGAIRWNLYMLTWSDQDPIPATGLLVDQRELAEGAAYGSFGWGRATPQFSTSLDTMVVPTGDSRYNYSEPSSCGQGLVASDRMVTVFDQTAPAVIRWTSNQQGNYTDFTAARGGGYKTLTSGNLFIPACVKLWQNPQSVDTLTILCMGIDGHSTSYYMAPAQVAQQSEATNIMGFEETTATPGTVSPYGCEVANNALYHPLDDQLMKSTATNYNINHASMTELIRNRWSGLANKHRIVSSFYDNRLYFVVHNPEGETLEEGCNGNEIWVLDIGKENSGAWSRWLIQAHSLRKIEHGGRNYMSVVRPDGLYYLDPLCDTDDVVDATSREISSEYIPWSLETNTQGANRAHDAWCHLQQVNLVVGNFLGTMRYGIRGHDINGKPVEVSKLIRDGGSETLGSDPWDLEDYLPIQRQLKEWFFFAESVLDEDETTVLRSTGQINLIQYRYTPVSVNVGYEWGSVETFEYGRAGNAESDRSTVNGVPMPYLDTGRP